MCHGLFGIYDKLMKTHVSRTVHIRSIRRCVCQPLLLSLVTSLVLLRLDYGSVIRNSITKHLMNRLQSLLNAAARLVYTTGFHHFCMTCTGCTYLSARFVWPFLCSAVTTRLHQTTGRERLIEMTAIGDDSEVACASHTTTNDQRPRLLCCCTARLERSARRHRFCTVTAIFKHRLKTHLFGQLFG